MSLPRVTEILESLKTTIETISTNLTSLVGKLLGTTTPTIHVFHDTATIAANGTEYVVNGAKQVSIWTEGTSTSYTLTFYVRMKASGPLIPIRALSPVWGDGLSAAYTDANNLGCWDIDITGKYSVVVDLTAIGNGNKTVKGRISA